MRWFLCARVCQGVGLRTLGEMFINRTYAVIERQEEQVNRVSGGVTKALLLCVPSLSCLPRFSFSRFAFSSRFKALCRCAHAVSMVSGLLLLLPPPPGHFVVVRVHSVVRSCTAPIFTDFWRVEPWGTLVHIISVFLYRWVVALR